MPLKNPLTDAQLAAEHPAVAELVKTLDLTAAEAPHLADPRDGIARLAGALALYFRTPD